MSDDTTNVLSNSEKKYFGFISQNKYAAFLLGGEKKSQTINQLLQ